MKIKKERERNIRIKKYEKVMYKEINEEKLVNF